MLARCLLWIAISVLARGKRADIEEPKRKSGPGTVDMFLWYLGAAAKFRKE